jgi:hypothetical protein
MQGTWTAFGRWQLGGGECGPLSKGRQHRKCCSIKPWGQMSVLGGGGFPCCSSVNLPLFVVKWELLAKASFRHEPKPQDLLAVKLCR